MQDPGIAILLPRFTFYSKSINLDFKKLPYTEASIIRSRSAKRFDDAILIGNDSGH